MSASFYDLLKYAKTGIAAPDMTAYDKMRAVAMAGGKVKTLTGVPPLTFIGNGKPLTSVTIKGNGQQNGTPAPDNIIMPTFCGVRTGNLFDKSTTQNGYYIDDANGKMKYSIGYVGVLSASDYIDIANASSIFITDTSRSKCGAYYDSSKTYVSGFNGYGSKSVPSTARYVRITVPNADLDSMMLNLGSTALPYEPYGWAEKITCAGQTTPLYLGQTQTVRKIRKLVLTGEEDWQIYTSAPNTYRVSISNTPSIGNPAMCSHFVNSPIAQIASGKFTVGSTWIYIRYADVADLADFKSYLAAQYAAGTPVTVWYVLAEPETAIVNEPLAKIGDYCDTLKTTTPIPTANGDNTLTVEGDLSPSSMTITYKS